MSEFVRRTEAPATSNAYYYANNPFYQSGYGMPNCTCYAWGRFWELSGTRPALSTRDAERWFGNTADGYQRGQTPKLGAVACWRRGDATTDEDGAGHVAIVEHINSDGTWVCSNSAWKSTLWYQKTISPAEGNTWNSKYTFQGFIYNPVNFEGSGADITVHSGNRYLSLTEMQDNARYIYNWLSARGWTLNAIAGLLGNFQSESTINPAIWQSLNEGNTSAGYGLVQWTPATKYLNWCTAEGLDPEDMDSALLRLEYELAEGIQYYPTDKYPLTFSEFKTSTKSAYYLGMAFVTNYERPARITTARGNNATYWYDYLANYSGTAEPGVPYEAPENKRKLPLWMMLQGARKR